MFLVFTDVCNRAPTYLNIFPPSDHSKNLFQRKFIQYHPDIKFFATTSKSVLAISAMKLFRRLPPPCLLNSYKGAFRTCEFNFLASHFLLSQHAIVLGTILGRKIWCMRMHWPYWSTTIAAEKAAVTEMREMGLELIGVIHDYYFQFGIPHNFAPF